MSRQPVNRYTKQGTIKCTITGLSLVLKEFKGNKFCFNFIYVSNVGTRYTFLDAKSTYLHMSCGQAIKLGVININYKICLSGFTTTLFKLD